MSPFGAMLPSAVLALFYGVCAMVWVVAGEALPGGRWLAVHLFTLGVVTNAVLAFSEHFGRTLTRQPGTATGWQTAAANVGVLMVLVGFQTGTRALLGAGATTMTAVVFASYLRLHRMRKQALGARFAWIVRQYERAHGAFVHGAILGLLMGIGALSAPWYSAARTAHLHINILGWAGVTLLATLVFFGPTMARTRIVEGADDRAAKALRIGTTALTVSTVLLLSTGLGGTPATVLRIAAALAMAAFAWAVSVICQAVAIAAKRSHGSASRWSVMALSLWFPVAVWADVAVIATGSWQLLDTLGLAMILGVLVQSIAAVLTYIVPMMRGPRAERDRVLARLERFAAARTVAYNLGVGTVVLAALGRGTVGARVGVAGWVMVSASLGYLMLAGSAPVRLPVRTTDRPSG